MADLRSKYNNKSALQISSTTFMDEWLYTLHCTDGEKTLSSNQDELLDGPKCAATLAVPTPH